MKNFSIKNYFTSNIVDTKKKIGIGSVVFLNGDSEQKHPITIISEKKVSGYMDTALYNFKGTNINASGNKTEYEFEGDKAFFLKGSIKTISIKPSLKEEAETHKELIETLKKEIEAQKDLIQALQIKAEQNVSKPKRKRVMAERDIVLRSVNLRKY